MRRSHVKTLYLNATETLCSIGCDCDWNWAIVTCTRDVSMQTFSLVMLIVLRPYSSNAITGFVVGFDCGVRCRGSTTFPQYVSLLFGKATLNQFVYTLDIIESIIRHDISTYIWKALSDIHSWKKGCYTPISDNTIDMDRIFMLSVGWNWHEMYPWLLPSEIRPYPGQIFTSVLSGTIDVQNHSLGGRFPEICLRTVETLNEQLQMFLNSH